MKKLLFAVSLLFSGRLAIAQTYASMNISLVGTLDPCDTVNWYGHGTKYSGVCGWVDQQDGKEYAILGATDGYYFIEVSNPSGPVLRDFESGINKNCLWREIKTYGNYCYMVSDDQAPNGLIVADLSYLPDSVHVVHKGNSIISRSHTIFVDGNKLYCGSVNTPSTGFKSMGVFDLSNPAAPAPLRFLDQDYPQVNSVHDMWAQNDTVFVSGGYSGLHIVKFNSATNTFVPINSFVSYPAGGYNHSSFRTADKNTLVFCDEVGANLPVKLLDVSNLSNLTLIDTVRSNMGATPHNPYILGNNLCFVAYYQDGLYVFDISNPANAFVAGYFDTHFQNGLNNNYATATPYMGAWGADPFLPSGKILVSDMQNGLFVLDASALGVGVKDHNNKPELNVNIFPNPASDELNVRIVNKMRAGMLEIFDVSGRKLISKPIDSKMISEHYIDIKALSSGMYELVFTTEETRIAKKFVKK